MSRKPQRHSRNHSRSFGATVRSLLCAIALLSAACLAQTASTGALSGTVTDPSGAAVPNADITITNHATGETRTVSSRADGSYVAPLLPPGIYTIEAQAQGFESATGSDIRIEITETEKFNVQLAVGATTQSVTVEGNANMVQTETSALGRVINERAVVALPLVTRNYTDLLALSPGVNTGVPNATQIGRGTGGTTGTFTVGGGVYVNGARSYENNFQINGIDVNDLQSNGTFSGGVAIPNPDTLQEFKVQTGLYDAQFGRNSGANVDVVTKSGSNQFHGALFEFFRNEALNANGYFFNRNGQRKGELRQNQFGFTLGGPIKKDKLLFFGSYQGTRQANGIVAGGSTSVFTPPLTDNRSAAALGALFGGQKGVFGGVALARDGSNINPVALKLLQFKLPNGNYLLPTPQRVDPTKRFAIQGSSFFSSPSTFNESQYLANIDYLASEKNKFEARFFTASSNQINPLNRNVPGFPVDTHNGFQNTSVAQTYSFSANLFNCAEIGFHRIFAFSFTTPVPFTFSDIGVTAPAQINALPSISISGSYNFGTAPPDRTIQNIYDVQDTVFYARGKHTLSAGGGLSYGQDNASLQIGGSLTFLSFPDFLLGLSASQNGTFFASNVFLSGGGFGFPQRALRTRNGFFFLQDDYKATSRLNLNLGLRYERIGTYYDASGRDANFNPVLAQSTPPASGSLAGFVVGSNYAGGSLPGGVVKRGSELLVNGDGQNTFGPRFGFAWQVLPTSGRLVLRGGYGIYYSQLPAQSMFQLNFGPPFGAFIFTSAGANAAATFSNPFPTVPPLSAFPIFTPYSPTTSLSQEEVAPNFRPSMTQQYTLNLQSQLAPDFLLEVGYVGTRGEHLIRSVDINQASLASPGSPIRGITTNTLANLRQRVPFQGFAPGAGIDQVETEGSSWYNGLNASLTKRFNHSLQFLAAYTFSKLLDTDGANADSTGNATPTIGNQLDPRARYGRADYDRTHRFVVSAVYDFPLTVTHLAGIGKVLGGWQASGVATIQPGQALTITYTNLRNIFGITGNGADRAQLAAGCSNANLTTSGPMTQRVDGYFNTACFTTPPIIGNEEPASTCQNHLPDGNCPAIGTAFGNSGVGIINGPGQQNYDLALMKHIPLPKETNLEFRAEFFNAFNHPQFANPDTNFSNTTFGKITITSVGPRVIQFALKVNF